MIGSLLGKINLYYLEGESKGGGGAAAPQTTNASLAGGVKGNVSWLLGDQSWLGKISGPKPAKENLPACFFHLFSPSLSPFIFRATFLPSHWEWKESAACRLGDDPLDEQLSTGCCLRGHGRVWVCHGGQQGLSLPWGLLRRGAEGLCLSAGVWQALWCMYESVHVACAERVDGWGRFRYLICTVHGSISTWRWVRLYYFVDVAKFIISVKCEGCASAVRGRMCSVSTRMTVFMSASVYRMRIPVCACAVDAGAPHGLFKASRAEGSLPDGFFPGSAKLWKQVGPSERPGTLVYCQAERLDSLSWLDLEL